MTPEEQHAWEVLKAIAERRHVELQWPKGKWITMHYFDRSTLEDVIANPHLYRIAKEDAE